MDKVKEIYSEKSVVAHFYNYAVLQNPEKSILKILEPHLATMKMLDIAAGAGRTTHFFAPLVKEYLAMDFSEGMYRACKKRFGHLANAKFLLGDMRTDLAQFNTHQLDFILCSFNGIDHLTIEERIAVLKQVRQICRPGGYFAFSSHNIQCIPDYIKIKFRLNILKLAKTLFNHRIFLERNKESLKISTQANYITLFDNLHDFGFNLCYIRPAYQINMLHELGFNNVRVFDFKQGKELSTNEIPENIDYWIYYLCS